MFKKFEIRPIVLNAVGQIHNERQQCFDAGRH